MKIFGNIIPVIRLALSITKYRKFLPVFDSLREKGDLDGERAEIARVTNEWSEGALKMFGCNVTIEGTENIPQEPCVFAANHVGYFDIISMFFAVKGKQIGFIAKQELEKVPLIGTWVKATRGLFIKRSDPREALKSISEGANRIKDGYSLVIFPEGTRSKGGEMRRFKAGALKLATKAKAPIVPVAIRGTADVYEVTGRVKKGANISIKFLPAYYTADMDRKALAGLPLIVESDIRTDLGLPPVTEQAAEEE